MSWSALADLGLVVRPFAGVQPAPAWQRSRFEAPLSRTLLDLGRELRALDAQKVVIELDVRDRDIRLDGYPRADAKAPGNPGVAISFESRHGPLRYATAEYDDWRHNLRAITLSMEALRAVDRYGVSKRGEQYQGWKALPQSTDAADAIQTRAQAEAFLAQWDGDWKRAVRATHPDQGGDETEFRKVMRAKELVA